MLKDLAMKDILGWSGVKQVGFPSSAWARLDWHLRQTVMQTLSFYLAPTFPEKCLFCISLKLWNASTFRAKRKRLFLCYFWICSMTQHNDININSPIAGTRASANCCGLCSNICVLCLTMNQLQQKLWYMIFRILYVDDKEIHMGIEAFELWIWKSQGQNGIWSFSYSRGNWSYNRNIRFFFKKIGLYLKRRKKRQKLHIFLNNICRHSLSVLSNRSRAVLQFTHLYSKKTANRSEIPPCLLFLMC